MLQEVTRMVVERGSTAGDKMPSVQVPTFSTSLRAKVYLWIIAYEVLTELSAYM